MPEKGPLQEIDAAHKHSSRNIDELDRSELAGCFYCCGTFAPGAIREWISHRGSGDEDTALCPGCGIDSVIGSAAGFPLTPEFLKQMKDRWFSASA